jgi:chain length determinant protein EpsF
MTLTQILIVLRARWRLGLTIMLSVVALVAAFTFLKTPLYTGTAAVVLDVKSPDPIAGVVLPGMNVPGYMATQLNIIQSERVALRVINALQLDKDPVLKAQWQEATDGVGSFQSWLSDRLLLKLDVTPARDSNVIGIAFTSPDPARASAVANAWVKAFVDTTVDLRAEPAKQYNSFFDARGKQLREELEAAQQRLSAFFKERGIVANDERLDVENLRYAELSSQLVALQGLANESSSRKGQSIGNGDRMQEVLNNPLVVALSTELAKQEARLTELNSRLGNNNPQVIDLKAHVAELRGGLATEKKRVSSSLTVNDDVNGSRLAQLRAAVDEQRNKMLQLKGQRDEAGVLQRDVENARRAYDAMLQRSSQTSIESQTTQTNVSVLKSATLPVLPSSPKVVLNLAVAVFIGLLLAIAGTLIRETRDRRLRTDEDVLLSLRQPLLGVLPAKAWGKLPSPSRLRLTSPRPRGLLRSVNQ